MNTVLQHWNDRASLGANAGTDDLIAKQLEQRALLNALGSTDVSVLEIGCGLGETARMVAEVLPDIVAVDAAPEMIKHAYDAAPDMDFRVADLFDIEGSYDLIYTQRCLINIADQDRALQTIADHLNPGGRYLSIECSQDGLNAINRARRTVDLPDIRPPYPWHRYLLDAELANVDCLRLVGRRDFSSTYYFLSRVVNARLAADRNEEPDYNSQLNRLALDLPSFGPWAQTRLWIWEKPWD